MPAPEGHALDRLRKGVFVGREKELERLRSAVDAMLGGESSVVTLVGEPGIALAAHDELEADQGKARVVGVHVVTLYSFEHKCDFRRAAFTML